MALPIVYRSPENPNVEAAKKLLKEKADALAARREKEQQRREAAGVPNYICYPTAFTNFDPKTGKGCPRPLPACNVCGDKLHPMENHKCSGEWKPKYEVFTDERKDRADQRRDEIRESRWSQRPRYPVCDKCGEEMPDYFEDGQRHWDDHEGRPVKNHFALGGEHDGDLDGYEDEPEEDYCEGDDDGYDCD